MNVQTMLLDNGVLVKHVRSRMRRQHLLPCMVAVLLLCICILWGCEASDMVTNGTAFLWLLGLQSCILFVIGTAQVAAAVGQARETGILDFHRIAPEPPLSTAIGFVLGAPILEYFLFACTLPFSLYCALQGKPGLGGFAQVMLVMLTTTLLYHCIGAVAGILSPRSRGVGGAIVGLIMGVNLLAMSLGAKGGALTIIPTAMSAMGFTLPGASNPSDMSILASSFFGLRLSPFVFTLLHELPLIVFLAIPLVRKMRQDQGSLYPKGVAVAFHGLIAFLALGDLWQMPGLEHTTAPAVYILVVAGLLLASSVTPRSGEFGNGVRRAHKRGEIRPSLWSELAPNWAPLLFMSAITLAAGLLMGLAPGQDGIETTGTVLPALAGACVVFYFGSARQYFDLRFKKNSQPFLLLFLFLSWLLPLIAGYFAEISHAGDQLVSAMIGVSPIAGIAFLGNVAHSHSSDGTVMGGMISLIIGLTITVIFTVLRRSAETTAARAALRLPGWGEEHRTQMRPGVG